MEKHRIVRESTGHHLLGKLALILTLILGSAITIAAFLLIQTGEQKALQTQIESLVKDQRDEIERGIETNLDHLYSVVGLYQSSTLVTREEFHIFTSLLIDRYSNIRGFRWLPRVTQNERFALEQKMRNEGYKEFSICKLEKDCKHTPEEEQDFYFPTIYATPEDVDNFVLGHDHFGDPRLRSSILKACESNSIAMSEPICYALGSASGICIYLPFWKDSMKSDSIEHSIESVGGILAMVISVEDLFSPRLNSRRENNFSLCVWDITDSSRLIFARNSDDDSLSGFYSLKDPNFTSDYSVRSKMEIGGRVWIVEFMPSASLIASQRSWASWIILICGILLTLLGTMYVDSMQGHARHIESVVALRTRELAQVVAKLEQLDRSKDDMIASVSHELKTPLTVIQESLSLMKDQVLGPMTSDQSEFVTIARRNSRHLEMLIGDLLDASVIQAGRNLSLKLEWFPLLTLYNELMALLQPRIEKSQQNLTLISLEDEIWLFADQRRLLQALMNFVSNASKFSTSRSEIIIGTEILSDGLSITVKDQGEGLTENQCTRIFEKFYRTKLSTNDFTEGTGLGLYISKQIIEAHEGKIGCISEPGRGSTFYMIIPKNKYQIKKVKDQVSC